MNYKIIENDGDVIILQFKTSENEGDIDAMTKAITEKVSADLNLDKEDRLWLCNIDDNWEGYDALEEAFIPALLENDTMENARESLLGEYFNISVHAYYNDKLGDFIKANASIINEVVHTVDESPDEDENYYCLPLWFQVNKEDNTVHGFHFDQLPFQLKRAIKNQRNDV